MSKIRCWLDIDRLTVETLRDQAQAAYKKARGKNRAALALVVEDLDRYLTTVETLRSMNLEELRLFRSWARDMSLPVTGVTLYIEAAEAARIVNAAKRIAERIAVRKPVGFRLGDIARIVTQ